MDSMNEAAAHFAAKHRAERCALCAAIGLALFLSVLLSLPYLLQE